jgi:hypothetical protein
VCCLATRFDDFITEFDLGDGDELMEKLCANITDASTTPNHQLHQPCEHHNYCSKCTRSLSPDNFDDESVICRECVRKHTNEFRKSAFRGIVREEPIPSSEVDVDIGEFLRVNSQSIIDIIQRGLDEHT